VCVCLCVYTCTYVRTYIHTHTHTQTCIHTYLEEHLGRKVNSLKHLLALCQLHDTDPHVSTHSWGWPHSVCVGVIYQRDCISHPLIRPTFLSHTTDCLLLPRSSSRYILCVCVCGAAHRRVDSISLSRCTGVRTLHHQHQNPTNRRR